MSRKRKINEIDTERVRKQAAELGAVVSEQAHHASERAHVLAEQGVDWATPRVEAAAAWAGPRVDKAWKDTVKVTAPKVEAATEKVRPAVDNAYERIVEDYLPRVQKAMHDAAEAASGNESLSVKAGKAGEAARKALAEPPKKSHGVAKTLGWIVVGSAAAGAGYLLWRRSQPVEDPWAEEYWDDTTVTSPAADAETGVTEDETLSTTATDAAIPAEPAAPAADVEDAGNVRAKHVLEETEAGGEPVEETGEKKDEV